VRRAPLSHNLKEYRMPVTGLYVKRFSTEFKPDPNDAAKSIDIDWVEYGAIASLDRSLTRERVSRLRDCLPPGKDNPAVAMAHARWDAIRPFYERWKSGQEMPVSGTPLAAWNALSPERADVLKSRGVRTVEDIAQLTDAHIERIPVRGLRDLIRQAQLFVDSADRTRFAHSLEKKDQEIAALNGQLDSLREQIAALTARVQEPSEKAANGDAEPKRPARKANGE
jgi:hypothetical protein